MLTNEQKMEKMRQVFELLNHDFVSPDDLIKTSEALFAIVNKAKKELADIVKQTNTERRSTSEATEKQLKALVSNLSALETKLTDNTNNLVSLTRNELEAQFQSLLEKQAVAIEKKIPDAKTIPKAFDPSVLNRIAKDHSEALAQLSTLISADNIRNALEVLPEEDKLSMEAVADLTDSLNDLREAIEKYRTEWKHDHQRVTALIVRRMDQIGDVVLTNLADGQVLSWNATTRRWENSTASGSGHTIEEEGTPLTTRTKLNFVGASVTVTDDAGDDATVVTISGGGSGITRSVSSIAGNTTAGSAASTDYVYFTTATLTLTLPTAVGNTNCYTVKCVSGVLTIDGAGAETIDGTATISVQVEDSVDLISNGTEWKVV